MTSNERVRNETQTGDKKMNQNEARERMLRELMSDLRNMVESGELTDEQANEWYSMKADQWVNGL